MCAFEDAVDAEDAARAVGAAGVPPYEGWASQHSFRPGRRQRKVVSPPQLVRRGGDHIARRSRRSRPWRSAATFGPAARCIFAATLGRRRHGRLLQPSPGLQSRPISAVMDPNAMAEAPDEAPKRGSHLEQFERSDADFPPDGSSAHGGRTLPAVTVDTYNEELRDDDGFVGDRASRRAFRAILAEWRDRLRERRGSARRYTDGGALQGEARQDAGERRSKVGCPRPYRGRGIRHRAGDRGASLPAAASWKDTERIVLGGGLIASRIGELSMGRASILLTAAAVDVELCSIRIIPMKLA